MDLTHHVRPDRVAAVTASVILAALLIPLWPSRGNTFARALRSHPGGWQRATLERQSAGTWRASAVMKHGGQRYTFVAVTDGPQDFMIDVELAPDGPTAKVPRPQATVRAKFRFTAGLVVSAESDLATDPGLGWLSGRATEFGQAVAAAVQ